MWMGLAFWLLVAVGQRSWAVQNLTEHPRVAWLQSNRSSVLVNFNILQISEPDFDDDMLSLQLAYEYHWWTDLQNVSFSLIGSQTTKDEIRTAPPQLQHPLGPIQVQRDQISQHDYIAQSSYWEIHVTPDGLAHLVTIMNHVIECGFNMRMYPFDQHNCTVYLASRDPDDGSIREMPVIIAKNHGLHQYFVQVTSDQCDVGAQETLTCLAARLELVHRSIYSIISVFIPCFCIVIISFINFWIEPGQVPARTALGITSVLSMTTLVVRDSPNHGYVVAYDIWLLAHLGFCVFSLLEFGFVHYFHAMFKAQSEGHKISFGKRKINASAVFAKRVPNVQEENISYPSCIYHHTDQISRVVMPLCYTVFVIVFVIWVSAGGATAPMSDVEYVTQPYG